MVKKLTSLVKRFVVSCVVTVVVIIGIVLLVAVIGAVNQHGTKLSAATTEAIQKLESFKSKSPQ